MRQRRRCIRWPVRQHSTENKKVLVVDDNTLNIKVLKRSLEDFKIKRLSNEYYKYSNKTLTINPDIVQFSEEMIYTTILRAFCKIKYRAGSKNYLNAMEIALKEY